MHNKQYETIENYYVFDKVLSDNIELLWYNVWRQG
jgi:hypothetical protein